MTPMLLVEDGAARATIVTPAQPSEAERAAAQQLQTCLWRMASVEGQPYEPVPIKGEDEGVEGTIIHVGRTAMSKPFASELSALDDVGFIIQTVADGLVLCGKEDLGTEYAVYTFLEKYGGVRWFWPGDLGEYVPRQRTVAVGHLSDREEPDFPLMQVGRDPQWRKRHKLLRLQHTGGGHSWGKMVPPGKFGPDHPEYFALVNGTRQRDWSAYNGQHGYQLCTTNPALLPICAADIRRRFDADERLVAFSVGANDGHGFCECDRCRAAGFGDADEREAPLPLLTDNIYAFTNRIAGAVARTHPDRTIMQFAYGVYIDPPRAVTLHPNVAPWITVNFEGDYAPEHRERNWRLMRQWSELAGNLIVYEYFNHTWKLQLPRAAPRALADAIPYYKRCGVKGIWAQSGNDFATEGLDYYVAAKLLWDIDQDVDALVADYCAKAFGAGGPTMRRYFQRLEECWADSVRAEYATLVPYGIGNPHHYLAMFTPAAMAELKGYLTAAAAAAEPGPDRQRVAFMQTGWQWTELELQAFRMLKKLADNGILEKYHRLGWKSKQVADLATLALPKDQARSLIEDTIAAWEARDRFVEKIKGQFIIDDRILAAWNVTDFRYHPVAALRKAMARHGWDG